MFGVYLSCFDDIRMRVFIGKFSFDFSYFLFYCMLRVRLGGMCFYYRGTELREGVLLFNF